jgi:hypothetical protein
MVANTFTTEFSIAAGAASAARAVDAGAAYAIKLHSDPKPTASRFETVIYRESYFPATEKASRALPELTYTVPFTIVAPPWSKGPPLALMPFLD